MAPSLHFRNGVYSALQEEQGILGVGGVQLRDRNASNAVQGLELESWLCLMELHLPCGSGEHTDILGLPRTLSDMLFL